MLIKPPDEKLEGEAAQDSSAGKENKNFDRLDAIEGAKHTVRMRVHATLAWLIPISLILAFILFWVGLVIYALHMFTNVGWLHAEQLAELRTVLFSSALGAVVSQGMKHYLE